MCVEIHLHRCIRARMRITSFKRHFGLTFGIHSQRIFHTKHKLLWSQKLNTCVVVCVSKHFIEMSSLRNTALGPLTIRRIYCLNHLHVRQNEIQLQINRMHWTCWTRLCTELTPRDCGCHTDIWKSKGMNGTFESCPWAKNLFPNDCSTTQSISLPYKWWWRRKKQLATIFMQVSVMCWPLVGRHVLVGS